MNLNEIKELFEQKKEAIIQLMEKYHIMSIGAFGPEISGHPFALNKNMNLLVTYETMSTSDLNIFKKELRHLTKCFLLDVYTESALKTLAEQRIITEDMSQNAILSVENFFSLNEKKRQTKLSGEEAKQNASFLAPYSRFFDSEASMENSFKSRPIFELEDRLKYHLQQSIILTNEISKHDSEFAKELLKQFNDTIQECSIKLGLTR